MMPSPWNGPSPPRGASAHHRHVCAVGNRFAPHGPGEFRNRTQSRVAETLPAIALGADSSSGVWRRHRAKYLGSGRVASPPGARRRCRSRWRVLVRQRGERIGRWSCWTVRWSCAPSTRISRTRRCAYDCQGARVEWKVDVCRARGKRHGVYPALVCAEFD